MTKIFTCPENTELFLWTVSRGCGVGGTEKELTTLKLPFCPKLVLSDGNSKTEMLAVFVFLLCTSLILKRWVRLIEIMFYFPNVFGILLCHVINVTITNQAF